MSTMQSNYSEQLRSIYNNHAYAQGVSSVAETAFSILTVISNQNKLRKILGEHLQTT